MPTSRATTPRPPPTRASIRCCPASTTGARGGRARSPGSTSCRTPTWSRTRCAFTWRPSEAIGTGLIFYKFLADKPAAFGPEVTSRDVAIELDWYLDWKVNKNFTVSFVGAYANPGKLVEQAYDRTKNFAYGMVYLAYSY